MLQSWCYFKKAIKCHNMHFKLTYLTHAVCCKVQHPELRFFKLFCFINYLFLSAKKDFIFYINPQLFAKHDFQWMLNPIAHPDPVFERFCYSRFVWTNDQCCHSSTADCLGKQEGTPDHDANWQLWGHWSNECWHNYKYWIITSRFLNDHYAKQTWGEWSHSLWIY